MKFALRTLLAVIVGLALAFVLLAAVEVFSAVVHPMPAELNGNVPEHVRRYPQWILAVAVLMWSGTAAAATWVAARVGNRIAAITVAVLLACALTFNLMMLPYVLWFKVAMPCAFPFACLLGITYGQRRVTRL